MARHVSEEEALLVRQSDRSAITRNKLMDATYRILRDVGHAGLRSANISSESGVSRGGLLHHYPSKEELVAAVYERILVDMEQNARSALVDVRNEDVLKQFVGVAQRRFFDESYRIVLDILVASGSEEPVIKVREAYSSPNYRMARLDWAERLADTGIGFDQASIVTRFLWATVKGTAIRALVRRDDVLEDRIMRSALRLAEQHCDALRRSA
ncbi:TetR/AcrR family transcriptional regulator [Sphingobium lactosutens]|uniref:TetR/AcrR family transcriptional regulator n=1 Tax=Sphingobium lactosutens TaxID=522773 RepID=UPI0004CEAB4A|nr:TetR/AcrR family transcriptional regulator [Sphingobium lactosutens]